MFKHLSGRHDQQHHSGSSEEYKYFLEVRDYVEKNPPPPSLGNANSVVTSLKSTRVSFDKVPISFVTDKKDASTAVMGDYTDNVLPAPTPAESIDALNYAEAFSKAVGNKSISILLDGAGAITAAISCKDYTVDAKSVRDTSYKYIKDLDGRNKFTNEVVNAVTKRSAGTIIAERARELAAQEILKFHEVVDRVNPRLPVEDLGIYGMHLLRQSFSVVFAFKELP